MAELDLAAPGNTPPDEMRPVERVMDEDGVWITKTRTRQSKSIDTATTPIEYIATGIYYRLETEHISDKIEWLVTSTRTIPGPYIYSRELIEAGATSAASIYRETKRRFVADSTYPFSGNAAIGTISVVILTNANDINAANTFSANDRVRFVGGILPGGINSTVLYYVLATGLTSGKFQVSLTSGGAAVTMTSNGSATTVYLTSANIAHQVVGKTAVVAWEQEETMVNGAGAVVSFPIYSKVEIDWKLKVYRITYRQEQAPPGTLPILSTTYGLGGVFKGASVNAITVTAAGSGYSTVATVAVAASGGVTAAAYAAMKATAISSYPSRGTLWSVNETVTITGGTGTATVLTVATLAVVSIAITSAGTGLALAQVLTLSGGTHPGGAATVTVTAASLASIARNASGSGHVIGDTLTLVGGTGTAATVTVSTLGLAALTVTGFGIDYAVNDLIVMAGGTSSIKAVITVTSVCVATPPAILSGGSGHSNGDVITCTGGTSSVAARFTVTSNSGGAITGVSVFNAGIFTVAPSTLTQSASTGGGTGATFNTLRYGIVGYTVSTVGSYTVAPASPTQDGSSTTSGTGATFGSAIYGVSTFALLTAGSYTGTLPTTFTSTGGSGTGATFNTPAWGAAAVTVATGGGYTVVAGSLTHASGFAGTPTWGIATATITTAGSYTALPPSGFVTATAAIAGVGYQPGDKLTLAGGTVSGSAAVLQVETTSGTKVATVSILTAGDYTAIATPRFTVSATTEGTSLVGTISVVTGTSIHDINATNSFAVGNRVRFSGGTVPGGLSSGILYWVIATNLSGSVFQVSLTSGGSAITLTSNGTGCSVYKQDSTTTSAGNGAEFTGIYKVVAEGTASGTGTGEQIILTYAVDAITVSDGGTLYDALTPPVVTVSGNATATATVTNIGWYLPDAVVVDGWIERNENKPTCWVTWVTMSTPPTRSRYISAPFTVPGYFWIANSGAWHNPPWPGYDFTSIDPRTGSWKCIEVCTYKLGAFLSSEINDTYNVTTPGARSKLWGIPSRTVHAAWQGSVSDGTYAELIAASTERGYFVSGNVGYFVVDVATRNVIGEIHELVTVLLEHPGF